VQTKDNKSLKEQLEIARGSCNQLDKAYMHVSRQLQTREAQMSALKQDVQDRDDMIVTLRQVPPFPIIII
jgi:hypothetical protein